MYCHQQVRVALKLTGQYHLLLVAAGKIPCLLLHGYAAYVVLFAHLLGIVLNGLFFQKQALFL